MTAFALRPMTVGEILDLAISLYLRNFTIFFGLVAVPNLLNLSVSLWSLFSTQYVLSAKGRIMTGHLHASSIWRFAALELVACIAGALSSGSIAQAVADLIAGRSTSSWRAIAVARRSFRSLYWAELLRYVAFWGGLVLLVIPGFYALCRFLVATPSVVLEGIRGGAALNRSTLLTKNHRRRALLLVAFYLFLSGVAVMAGYYSIEWLRGCFTPNAVSLQTWVAFRRVCTYTLESLVEPISLIAITLFYFDLRSRKEAFDLELLMQVTKSTDSQH